MVDIRKSKSVPSTFIVNNSEVDIVDSFTCLGIHITSSLSWSLHARYMCKKGQQRLYFLRCLKKFHIDLPDLREMFYCRVKSRIHKVIADPSHPAFTLFELLPSGKRYRSLGYSGMSSRTSNSLYPTAVHVLNDVIH